MLTVSNLSLQFGKRILFDGVNIQFTQGNCYGIIGANGSGKSTFLKILSHQQDPTTGHISLLPSKRMSVLQQDHHAFNSYNVLETVIQGNKKLYKIKKEMELLYQKSDFSEQDGIKAGELTLSYEEMNGWNCETDASELLSNLGVSEKFHNQTMGTVDAKIKVRILLAQALFGNPDVLILDEPTNDLDIQTISWLEDFLSRYENTVITVSHDRHFLDAICTHICDLDFSKINLFTGNYSFWYEASQLATKQKAQQNKKAEEKKKELQEFIQRFSSNVAKAKQATARKKMIDKLNFDDIKPSSRRYPAILFEQERQAGDQILKVENLAKKIEDGSLFEKLTFSLKKGDKIAILSRNSQAKSAFFDILMNETKDYQGTFSWGVTTKQAYLPAHNEKYFQKNLDLVQWLREYAQTEEQRHEEYLRGFLGKMLFSGDEALKKVNVLSGGEKMRCMFSKMMLLKANILLLDEPTNHLDLESITSLNNALKSFSGTLFISSYDHELIQTVCNRIIEITPKGIIDKYMDYDEYLNDPKIKEMQQKYYEV